MHADEHQELFLRWLGEHGSAVIKVARAYTLTHDECQDLAQEILLQAWRSLPTFQQNSSAATWFYRVALNTALNWRRQERPRRIRQRPFLEIETIPLDDRESDAAQERRETLERLYQAIHQLPRQDAALVLLYLDDLSYREMADVLGISENHVGVRLTRARKELGELMREPSDVH